MNPPVAPPSPHPEVVQHLERAYDLEARDDLAAALRACDAALAPNWAEAHNLRGIILEAQGRQRKAVDAFRRTAYLDSEDADFATTAAASGARRTWKI